MKKAIIIGNGIDTLKKEYGQIIDSFDLVIRCNKFKILPPYHKYTGTKTDYIFCIDKHLYRFFETEEYQKNIVIQEYNDFLNFYKLDDSKKIKNLFFENFFYNKENFNFNKKIICLTGSDSVKKYKSLILSYININKIFNKKIIRENHTTGFYAILFFKNFFKNYEIYISGFDSFFKCCFYWEKEIDKYLDSKKLIAIKTRKYGSHPYLKEYILIKNMLKSGQIKSISSFEQ